MRIVKIKKNTIALEFTIHFDSNRPTKLTVYESPDLSRAQENGHDFCIAHAIFFLTPAEVRYSQTDKETLAPVWGC